MDVDISELLKVAHLDNVLVYCIIVVLFVLLNYDKFKNALLSIKRDFWKRGEEQKLVSLLKAYSETIRRNETPSINNVSLHCSLPLNEVYEYSEIAYKKGLLRADLFEIDLQAGGAPVEYYVPSKEGKAFLQKKSKLPS